MSGAQDVLSPEEHARIFDTEILPRSGLDRLASHEHPRVVFLGGQPGAGKGGLNRSVSKELGGDVITVDTDELRRFHPRVGEFREQNPLTWSGRTHQDARAWADELGAHAIAGRKNVIFDTTLSDGNWVSEQIKELRAKGFEPEVWVVATHKLESEVGVEQRFIDQFDEEGYGRHVPRGVREHVYDKLPGNLDTIQERTGARILIYDREGRQRYDSHEPGETRKPGQVLEEARDARMRDPAVVDRTRRAYDEARSWHENLPENVGANPHASPAAKQALPAELEAGKMSVLEGLRENGAKVESIQESLARGAAKGGLVEGAGRAAGVVGVGLMAVDAYQTGREYAALGGKGNATGADALLRQYEGRTAGGVLGGIGAGAAYGALAGSETGPGAIATGIVGGVVGAFVGEKLANKITEYKVDHQAGSDGKTYSYHDGQWTSTERRIDWNSGWMPRLASSATAAPDSQRPTLDYKRTAAVTELALAHPRQQDTRNITLDGTEWHASHGTWTKQVYDDSVPIDPLGGFPIPQRQPADARTTATLDRLAANRQYNNDHYGEDVAKAYVMDHYGKGWNRIGPLPDAVASELHRPSETNVKDPVTGQFWTTDGHGGFTRNTYVPTMTGGIVAAPVSADPAETARLDKVRNDAMRSNTAYGTQVIHEAYREVRNQSQAEAEDQRAAAANRWASFAQHHAAMQEQRRQTSTPDQQAGQAPAAQTPAVEVQGPRRGP